MKLQIGAVRKALMKTALWLRMSRMMTIDRQNGREGQDAGGGEEG